MLREKFRQKKFVMTAEVSPPHGTDTEKFSHEIKGTDADAINVTDCPGAHLRMGPLAGSILVKESGKEPIFQLTCRDRNSLALTGDLLGAAAFGVSNVLALTGDSPRIGDVKGAKPVFEMNSVSLIGLIANLNKGKSPAGELKGNTDFFIGAAINPNYPNLSPEVEKTKKKLKAGAEFFQTQPIFEISQIGRFISEYEKEKNTPEIRKRTLVGVLTLHSPKIIPALKSLPGIIIPERIEKRIKDARDPREESLSLALGLIDEIKVMGFGGAHLITLGEHGLFNRIISQVK